MKATRLLLGFLLCSSGCEHKASSSRLCSLPWSLDGTLVCQADLHDLSRTFAQRRVRAAQIRPGATYRLLGDELRETGVMDPRWLALFEVAVWFHGDRSPWLRSLRGVGSRRLARLQDCPAQSCCDPLRVRGIGPKTVKGWAKRVVLDPDDAPCIRWEAPGFSLAGCALPTRGSSSP